MPKQHVVSAAPASILKGRNIARLFDDKNPCCITTRIRANAARTAVGQVVTHCAGERIASCVRVRLCNAEPRMPKTVAFDESGNTGANLFDADQPLFVQASVCVPPEDANALVQSQATTGELHFSRMRKNANGRDEILKILNAPELSQERVFYSIVHKPFVVVAKMVDLLIT